MKINLPNDVLTIIGRLETAGFAAYAVGGCVRDTIMNQQPKDWDICTNAKPDEVMQCFSDEQIIATGLQHGTVTLILNQLPYEITTFRTDGTYSDSRHPDKVEFIADIKGDLSRRDFTINALAYNPRQGLLDFFDGEDDIKYKLIRCVGEPDDRFREDALRIMRALRFAAVLGFTIEEKTATALRLNCSLLSNIAVERISWELNNLLLGKNAGAILLDYVKVLAVVIPELTAMVGFKQNNPYHHLDIWTHTVKSVVKAPADPLIRLTLLFHDIGKPHCYTETASVGHFYRHHQTGSDMARTILSRLKFDNETIQTVTKLILYHDADVQATPKSIKRWLNRLGEKLFSMLLTVKRADALAQAKPANQGKQALLDSIEPVLEMIIEQQQCYSLTDLAINGNDLIALGIPQGRAIGAILNQLLQLVIDEDLGNNKDALSTAALNLIKRQIPDV